MVASASAFVTRLHASDEAEVPGAALPGAALPGAELAPTALALAPAEADGFADVRLLDDGAALDVASDALGRADDAAELVPRAAGDPLEPPVVVDG